MNTKIHNITDDWKRVKNVSRRTVGKNHSEIEATESFKKKILLSEHSPIRELIVKWEWTDIKSFVATHFSRHNWEVYIKTSRSDRTGIDRSKLSQEELVDMDCTANIQHLIDTSRKRLCYCSSKETREAWEDLKKLIRLYGESEIADVMVPNCVYRMGCPEFEECGFLTKFLKNNDGVDLFDIQDRYDGYNSGFFGEE